jgi:hypothetical protein
MSAVDLLEEGRAGSDPPSTTTGRRIRSLPIIVEQLLQVMGPRIDDTAVENWELAPISHHNETGPTSKGETQ